MIYKKLVAIAHKTGTDLVFAHKTGTDLIFAQKTGTDLVFAQKTGTEIVFYTKNRDRPCFLNFILTQKTAFQIEKQSNQVQMKSLRFKRGRDWKSAKRPPQRSET